jgi:hypothetical protein
MLILLARLDADSTLFERLLPFFRAADWDGPEVRTVPREPVTPRQRNSSKTARIHAVLWLVPGKEFCYG